MVEYDQGVAGTGKTHTFDPALEFGNNTAETNERGKSTSSTIDVRHHTTSVINLFIRGNQLLIIWAGVPSSKK